MVNAENSNAASPNGVVDINELIKRNGPYADTLRDLVAEGFTGTEYLASSKPSRLPGPSDPPPSR